MAGKRKPAEKGDDRADGSDSSGSGGGRGNGLRVVEDLNFQRRSWKAQRIGWMVMVLIVLAALLGLFGTGPLSSAVTGDAGSPVRVEYERFLRYDAPALLRIHLSAGVVRGGQARIWIDRGWLDCIQTRQITPQPGRVEMTGDRVIYTFNVVEPNHPGSIAFHFTTRQFGRLRGRVGTDTGYEAPFRQFVYP